MSSVFLEYHENQGWLTDFPPLDSPQTLVLVFGHPETVQHLQAFQTLKAAYPQSHILGCSSTGAIAGPTIREEGLVALVHHFDKTRLEHQIFAITDPEDSFEIGQKITQTLLKPGLRGIWVFSDGIHVNGSQLVRGLQQNLPAEVMVAGGLAGDGAKFEQTWVLEGANPQSQAVVAVGFYGDHIRMASGSESSWNIFGVERQVTRSRGNVVYEIDHKPALELYKNYLGELAEGLPATALLFPLNLRTACGQSVVRTIISVNEADQSLIFAGDVPENHRVQLMKSNPERLIDGALASAQQAYLEGATPVLGLAVSCVGRQFVLQQRVEEEVEAVAETFPQGMPLVGFYSHGEIAPHHGICELHNQTMTVMTIYEA